MQRVVLCVTVSLALVFSASLAAGGAGAQSGGGGGGGDKLRVGTKTVKKFIKRRARIVGLGQMPVFPNARITRTEPWASCSRSSLSKARWVCAWHATVYEESKRDPLPYQVRQSTLRWCGPPENRDGYAVLYVKRARASRRLRVVGPWRVSCELTESSIDSWNVFAYDDEDVWQPVRSEPLPVPESTLPPPKPQSQGELDLLPAPPGEPGGPPPGPLSTGTEYQSSRTSGARSSSTTGGTGYLWRGGSSLGCTQWMRYQGDPRYWVFYCYWRPPAAATLPGAALGIYTQDTVTYWEGYYWAGNDNYGRPLGKLFASGQY